MGFEQGTDPWSTFLATIVGTIKLEYHDGIGELRLAQSLCMLVL